MIPILGLARAVTPSFSKRKRMLMLAAYADESGHSKDTNCRFVGLGGFVATAEQWEIFESLWRSALDSFNEGEEFHAKEFFRKDPKSRYATWSQEKREGFMDSLTSAINTSGAEAVGCVVSLEAYEKLDESFQKAIKDPFYMAFQEVTKGLALSGAPQDNTLAIDPVSMVYAFQSEYGVTKAGRAMQLWNTIKQKPKQFTWAKWMGTYTSAFPRDVLPLQAADLFAYELTREFEKWRLQPIPPMRMALKNILRAQENPLLKLYEMSAMLDMIWNSGGFGDVNNRDSPIALEALMVGKEIRDGLRMRSRE